jgi:hypothetical protein
MENISQTESLLALLPIEWVISGVKRGLDADITDEFDDLRCMRK